MRVTVSLIAAAFAIAGCGYKTPLTLPKPQAERPAPPASAQSDEKKSRDEPAR